MIAPRLKIVRRWALVNAEKRAVCFSYRMQPVRRKAQNCADMLRYTAGVRLQVRQVEVRDARVCRWRWNSHRVPAGWEADCSGIYAGRWNSTTPPKCCPSCGARVRQVRS
jgi:hypothetical protein